MEGRALSEMIRAIRTLTRRVVENERRLAQMIMPGEVAEVDHAARRLRLKLGETAAGSPILSPWVRWAEAGNSALKVHSPPTVGTLMTLLSPSGTVGAGSTAHWSTYTDDHKAPSDAGDEAVIEFGPTRITFGAAGVVIESGTITLKGDVDVVEGHLHHDGTNVGKDHPHKDTQPGAGLSGPPA